MAERGQVCNHDLEKVGRHRVCRECITVYMAVAGPHELILLGSHSAVLSLLMEYDELKAARTASGQGEASAEGMQDVVK
jgi:hypothetical protein